MLNSICVEGLYGLYNYTLDLTQGGWREGVWNGIMKIKV